MQLLENVRKKNDLLGEIKWGVELNSNCSNKLICAEFKLAKQLLCNKLAE